MTRRTTSQTGTTARQTGTTRKVGATVVRTATTTPTTAEAAAKEERKYREICPARRGKCGRFQHHVYNMNS